jgi:hypothetical protein
MGRSRYKREKDKGKNIILVTWKALRFVSIFINIYEYISIFMNIYVIIYRLRV